MPQTKAQRSAAAKKGAATRKRNQAKADSEGLGRRLDRLARSGESVAEDAKDLAKTAGSAAKTTAEATAQRAREELRRRSH